MFKKLLVANRGEIAVRIIRAARELGLGTVAVYSEADRESLAVRLADEAVAIGPPPASKSYLDMGAIIAAAERSGAGAIHPGYGFLSENARFAAAVEAAGLVFVGPTPETIRLMGDKAEARAAAMRAGVPIVPGSDGEVGDLAAAQAAAHAIGYPVMLKASAGGGGRGIRIVEQPAALERQFRMAQQEAAAAFGNGALYIERFIGKARHIEVQVLGDGERVLHCFERECSLQRRRQKIWEEAPAPTLDAATRDALCASAVRLAEQAKYRGAGTLEYLYDETSGEFFFIEMNTRIQVEHPVTEMVTGIDLVQQMIRVAQGERLALKQDDIVARGAAIEVRINAEDPARNFLPTPGRVGTARLSDGSGRPRRQHALSRLCRCRPITIRCSPSLSCMPRTASVRWRGSAARSRSSPSRASRPPRRCTGASWRCEDVRRGTCRHRFPGTAGSRRRRPRGAAEIAEGIAMSAVRYSFGGDEHVFVELNEEMSLEAFFKGMAICGELRKRRVPGRQRDLPGQRLLPHPLRSRHHRVPRRCCKTLQEIEAAVGAADLELPTRIVEIPVLYNDPWTHETLMRFRERHQDPSSTDLEYAARINNYPSVDAFIAAHSGAPWFVSMVGFVAGLPFLFQMVDRAKQIEVPKYLRPRTDTPKLTVGHGGCFGCIYSVRGAGGYQMFGITPAPIFDPAQKLPYLKDFMCFFKGGDIVKWRPITREEYDRDLAAVEAGTFALKSRPVTFSLKAFSRDPSGYAKSLVETLHGH